MRALPTAWIAAFLLPWGAEARGAAPASRQDLFKARKPALVKIEVAYGGVPLQSGTGFFLSELGELAAPYSLLADVFLMDGVSATFRMTDGSAARRFKVASCGDRPAVDLCLLKLDHRPKAWFGRPKAPPVLGQRAFLLGRRGANYDFSDGTVGAVEKTGGVAGIRISNPFGPGQFGGAVLGEDGELLGMTLPASWGGPAVLAAEEIYASVSRSRYYREEVHFAELLRSGRRRSGAQLEERYLEGARRAMAEGEDLSKLLKTKIDFRQGKTYFRGFLPDLGWKCEAPRSDPGRVSCQQIDPALGPVARFGVRVSEWKGTKDLPAAEAGRKIPSEPADWVQALQKEGRWGRDSALLDEEQKKPLFSKPGDPSCAMAFEGVFKGRFSCSRRTEDAGRPGGSSLVLSFVDGGFLYEFSAWCGDPGLSPFYMKLPALFAGTLRKLMIARAPKEPSGFDERWLKLKP